jgi:hypothetical protein
VSRLFRTLLTLSFALPFQHRTAQEHETKRLESKHSRLTFEALDQRLHNIAAEYQPKYGKIPRAAVYDIAYPSSAEEFAALNQQAVLLITAVTQDSTELPFDRVYLHVDGQADKDLVVLSRYFSKTEKDPIVRETIGHYREDLFCLVSVTEIISHPGQLLLDFRIHRAGFVLEHFPLTAPEKFLTVDKTPHPKPTDPVSKEALKTMLLRKFPDFESAGFKTEPFQN